ncbi:hypothetical protein HDE_13019 [Halotydeus destructor]|nr:hypothetical protein HDE_13019 [Halotydeus destructor]
MDDFELFLDAIREVNGSGEDDVVAIKAQLQACQSQFEHLSKEHKKCSLVRKKQQLLIEQLNQERIKTKKQLIELSYGKKSAEAALSSTGTELAAIKRELKSKNDLMIAIEKERKRSELDSNPSAHRSVSSNHLPIVATVNPRIRSSSVDRLRDKRDQQSKQLLIRSNLVQAYTASREDLATITSGSPSPLPRSDLEKIVLLQKLLLTKSRQLIERDVQLEELNRTLEHQQQLVERLKRVKQFTDELTQTRHQLNVRNAQLAAVKKECLKYKLKADNLKFESVKLRDRLNQFYTERNLLN